MGGHSGKFLPNLHQFFVRDENLPVCTLLFKTQTHLSELHLNKHIMDEKYLSLVSSLLDGGIDSQSNSFDSNVSGAKTAFAANGNDDDCKIDIYENY